MSSKTSNSAQEFLSVDQAAARLGISRSWLKRMRLNGGGPPFMRIGYRTIRYPANALEAWAAKRTVKYQKRKAQ